MQNAARLLPLLLVGLLATMALLVAACGNDDDDAEPTSEPTSQADPTEEPTEGAEPTQSASPTQSGSETPSGEDRSDASGTITVYSGRSEELIGPLIEDFEEATGITVEVRYAGTPELAATILEEGSNSPADLYIGQDAGSVGLLASEGIFMELPEDILAMVPESYRAEAGDWVGLSGRARVVVYNTETLSPDDMPESIFDYTEPEWEGRIGWAPTNASFQSFITGMRVAHGDEATQEWIEGIRDNRAQEFPNNSSQVEAAANGEIDVGFVNHYYLFRFLAEQGEDFQARNYYFENGDIGGLMNVSGVGILSTTGNQLAAERFVEFMLSTEAQEFYANETFEFPLVEGVAVNHEVPSLDTLQPVQIDLTDLADVEESVELLQSAGVLP